MLAMPAFNFSQEKLDQLLAQVTTVAELDHVEQLWELATQANLLAASADLRKNSLKFLTLIDPMLAHIDYLASSSAFNQSSVTNAMREELGSLHSQLHGSEGNGKTYSGSEDTAIEEENTDQVNNTDTVTVSKQHPNANADTLKAPKPINSSKFRLLAGEYQLFFEHTVIEPTELVQINKFATLARSYKKRYCQVGDPLGIPWWFIAVLHLLESTFNFTTHLHNGDPLSARTKREPKGRPKTGSAPFTW
ncbi:MAG: hypothetical protein ACI9ES_002349, partial [Oceanospirillaceae bacterium]